MNLSSALTRDYAHDSALGGGKNKAKQSQSKPAVGCKLEARSLKCEMTGSNYGVCDRGLPVVRASGVILIWRQPADFSFLSVMGGVFYCQIRGFVRTSLFCADFAGFDSFSAS